MHTRPFSWRASLFRSIGAMRAGPGAGSLMVLYPETSLRQARGRR